MDHTETIMNFIYTWMAILVANWAAIGGAVLMIMQGIYLWYKIRKARKECKGG